MGEGSEVPLQDCRGLGRGCYMNPLPHPRPMITSSTTVQYLEHYQGQTFRRLRNVTNWKGKKNVLFPGVGIGTFRPQGLGVFVLGLMSWLKVHGSRFRVLGLGV